MTTNTFDTEESNSSISSPQYYVDDDGSLKFISPVLSSSNFDGSVPVFEGQISASAISPGKFIKIGEEYFPVLSVSYDDPELEDDPSEEITATYLDSNSEVQSITYNLFDDVDVKYENWEEKYLGTQGWSLTYGGNAIFTNVAVRGRIEAEEGYISGNLTIGSEGTDTLSDVLLPEDVFITGTTQISGGRIRTGQIESAGYSGGNVLGTEFSESGMSINLDYGSLSAPNFRIDYLGNAVFSGSVVAKTFQTEIGLNNNHIAIEDDTFSKSDKITFLASTTISGASTRPSNDIGAEPNIQVEYKDYGSYTEKSLVLTGWKAPGILGSPPNLRINTKNDGSRSISLLAEDVYMTNANVYGKFIGDGSQLTGIVSGTSYNYTLSQSGPGAASNYADGYVWYVY